MHYAIADIHGCFDEFIELLGKIHFSQQDILFVIGDTVDRGPKPVEVLQFMAMHHNIIPIMGNHELMMMRVLPKFLKEINSDNMDDTLTLEYLTYVGQWVQNGGKETADAFRAISEEEADFLLDYVGDFSFMETIDIGDKEYCMIHTLPHDFYQHPVLEDVVDIQEFMFSRPDFQAEWKQDMIYVIGHTPTVTIGEEYEGKIYRKDNLINIDCGCVFGRSLAAFCLETEEVFYVENIKYRYEERKMGLPDEPSAEEDSPAAPKKSPDDSEDSATSDTPVAEVEAPAAPDGSVSNS